MIIKLKKAFNLILNDPKLFYFILRRRFDFLVFPINFALFSIRVRKFKNDKSEIKKLKFIGNLGPLDQQYINAVLEYRLPVFGGKFVNVKSHLNNQLIDWHTDKISGYTWKRRYFWKIKYGNIEGVDVKFPWEVSRLQWLLPLALREETAKKYAEEIYAILRDFIRNNPAGNGVNWACTMDVAIRSANMAIIYSLIKKYSIDEKIDEEIDNFLKISIEFISCNIEWNDFLRGNHYLSNLSSLIVILYFYQDERRYDETFKIIYTQLLKEIDLQFNMDGSNFEGSSYYHRLSVEMAIFGLVFGSAQYRRIASWDAIKLSHKTSIDRIIGLSDEFSASEVKQQISMCIGRLRKGKEFVDAISTDDNCMVQIGDNDSGKFIYCNPSTYNSGGKIYYNSRNIEELMSLYHFLEGSTSKSVVGTFLHTIIDIKAIAQMSNFKSGKTSTAPTIIKRSVSLKENNYYKVNTFRKQYSELRAFKTFTSFGLYVWYFENFRYVVKAGNIGQNGYGGHDHCDQLSSFIIPKNSTMSDVDKFDPGTGCYTPHVNVRNKYRSMEAHGLPFIPGKRNFFENGPFQLKDYPPAKVLNCDTRLFEAEQWIDKTHLLRRIVVERGTLMDVLYSNQELIIDQTCSLKPSRNYGCL